MYTWRNPYTRECPHVFCSPCQQYMAIWWFKQASYCYLNSLTHCSIWNVSNIWSRKKTTRTSSGMLTGKNIQRCNQKQVMYNTFRPNYILPLINLETKTPSSTCLSLLAPKETLIKPQQPSTNVNWVIRDDHAQFWDLCILWHWWLHYTYNTSARKN